jgi:hypothetical protein
MLRSSIQKPSKRFSTAKVTQQTTKKAQKGCKISSPTPTSKKYQKNHAISSHIHTTSLKIDTIVLNNTTRSFNTSTSTTNSSQGSLLAQFQANYDTSTTHSIISTPKLQLNHNITTINDALPQISPISTQKRTFRSTLKQKNDETTPTMKPNDCSHPDIIHLFDKLNGGLVPMLDTNPRMSITTEKDVYEVDLGPDLGVYHFERDANEDYLLRIHSHIVAPIVYMASPISGTVHRYYYDKKRLNDWISIDDEHYLVELMTRELLKKCYGYPMF